MVRIFSALIMTMLWCGIIFAGEPTEPPKIVLDAPPPKKVAKEQVIETETVTIYESKVFPGFRPCVPEDYRKQDYDPIACQDDDVARILSTRGEDRQSMDLIVEDSAVSQGNIYKLRFERFKKRK
jgi:hypothetical protein